MKRVLSVLTVLGLLIVGFAVTAFSTDNRVSCNTKTVSVRLSETTPRYNLVGELCVPKHASTVELLVPGLSYDNVYWNFPYKNGRYSFTKVANQAGFATFNIDRLGTGKSDKPPADDLSVLSHAYTIHQVAQYLHGQFKSVIGVGHSMGSAILMVHAAMYTGDFTRLILTDYLHSLNPAIIPVIQASRHLAIDDPKFVNAGLPDGYTTTIPGFREKLFFNSGFAESKIINMDEALKSTSTGLEASTVLTARNPLYSQQIKVKTLVVVGQQDALYCNTELGFPCTNATAVYKREASSYSTQAHLAVMVLPKAGHDINLHLDAPAWYGFSQEWLKH